MWLTNAQYIDGLRSYDLVIFIIKWTHFWVETKVNGGETKVNDDVTKVNDDETNANNDELKAVVEGNSSRTTLELAARLSDISPPILNHLKHIV